MYDTEKKKKVTIQEVTNYGIKVNVDGNIEEYCDPTMLTPIKEE